MALQPSGSGLLILLQPPVDGKGHENSLWSRLQPSSRPGKRGQIEEGIVPVSLLPDKSLRQTSWDQVEDTSMQREADKDGVRFMTRIINQQ